MPRSRGAGRSNAEEPFRANTEPDHANPEPDRADPEPGRDGPAPVPRRAVAKLAAGR